ncbi:MAG TPA: (2Fe-2S)-binding protein [Candidatus Binatia bacterium]|nr:(2Fe-2S)-binding protein [Candidatus Binatia bacterium]
MIVCHCAGVTDANIVELVREGATSVADIVRRSGAGRCCMPCREEIASILSEQQAAASRA